MVVRHPDSGPDDTSVLSTRSDQRGEFLRFAILARCTSQRHADAIRTSSDIVLCRYRHAACHLSDAGRLRDKAQDQAF